MTVIFPLFSDDLISLLFSLQSICYSHYVAVTSNEPLSLKLFIPSRKFFSDTTKNGDQSNLPHPRLYFLSSLWIEEVFSSSIYFIPNQSLFSFSSLCLRKFKDVSFILDLFYRFKINVKGCLVSITDLGPDSLTYDRDTFTSGIYDRIYQ